MKIHIVQKGDTLWEIAKKYNVDFEELKQLNSHLASPDMIMPGMKIRIPTATKTIKQGKSNTEIQKTMPAKKGTPLQEQKKMQVKKATPVQEQKKMQVKKETAIQEQKKVAPAEKPKLMHEKPSTLPILEVEKEYHPITVPPKKTQPKEKTVVKKKEAKKEKPVQPVQPVPVPQYPTYEAPLLAEYPCYPPVYMNPCCSPCNFHYPMMMPEHMGCGCQQGYQMQQPGYYPINIQPSMQPMYNSYPSEGAQMYSNQQQMFQSARDELEMYPTPPVYPSKNQEERTSDKNQTEE